ncbi:unnamed protein product [Cylicocyclus nassatus]|uniref:Uncharacterized protein n=1 Tax=Cylicocyclus nassatus TaxID=53992 RepID=A0AA36DPM6_CYLNA|nr:unnamed protein product [Cylicocyclus nassatus]
MLVERGFYQFVHIYIFSNHYLYEVLFNHHFNAVEKLEKWKILALQIFLPTLTVSPLYLIFEFHYVVNYDRVSLSSTNVLFLLGLTYRGAAFALCVSGYLFLFFTVKSKA